MTMPLDDQISVLESIPTTTAEQYRAKNSILATLQKLKSIRSQFEKERPNENTVVALLLGVLGEDKPAKGKKPVPSS
jgi:hypothetical protein